MDDTIIIRRKGPDNDRNCQITNSIDTKFEHNQENGVFTLSKKGLVHKIFNKFVMGDCKDAAPRKKS